MADAQMPPNGVTRRMLLVGVGTAAVAAPAAVWLDRSGYLARPSPRTPAASACCAPYVDVSGWMLTPEDRTRLEGVDLSQ